MITYIKSQLQKLRNRKERAATSASSPSVRKYIVHRLKTPGDLLKATGPLLVQGPDQAKLIDLNGATGFGIDHVDGDSSRSTLWLSMKDGQQKQELMRFTQAVDATDVYTQLVACLTGKGASKGSSLNASPASTNPFFKRLLVSVSWLLIGMVVLVAIALATAMTGVGTQHPMNLINTGCTWT